MSTVYLWTPDPPEGYGAFDNQDEPEMDLSMVHNIEFDDIDYGDAPDFCDAFICYAEYDDREMTEDELEKLNENRDFVHEKLIDYLY